MEYLECFGSKIRKNDIPVTTQDVINMAYDIGNALLDVHKNKMIHRDIKPDNIFIDEFGYYKLGDLGVTKSINASGYASTRTGTEPYAAPEVWRAESYTESAYTYKADIYSFGIVLYQLMNNNFLPFMNDFTHNELEKSISMRMRGEKISPPANGSEEFKNIICRMCQFNPDDRFSDMSEFLSALSKVGKRSDSADQSEDLNLKPGSPADEIPTLDANEGCAFYKPVDEQPKKTGVETYIPVTEDDTEFIDESQASHDADAVSAQLVQKHEVGDPVTTQQNDKPEQQQSLITVLNNSNDPVKNVLQNPSSESLQTKDVNVISEFQTHQKCSDTKSIFSEDTVFHTFPAQCEAVNRINAESGKDKKIILSTDGVFRKEDYHRVRVKDGLLVIPGGYFTVAPFTLYKIERDLITQIDIPQSVTSFENDAFRDLTQLKKINISGDVMIIRSNLFSECVSLQTVVLPLSTRKIEDYAFDGCKSLRLVDARGYITGIGKNAFSGCDNVVIKCKKNSFMHKYCIKYNIRTELIDGETGE